MQCSACDLVGSKLSDSLDSKIATSFKKWSPKIRLTKIRAAMKKACTKTEAMQIAVSGSTGQRQFGDFNEMMKRGGTMTGLSMTPEHSKALKSLCEAVVDDHADQLVSLMSASVKAGKRLLDFKLRDELCENMLAACHKPEKAPRGFYDDDEDDPNDEDENDEL
eukprot:CAMPEP_0119315302 /NCGR_PEP_ID=MMETSP1333-20130426/35227_1 /TAXON_ID=418940 /ORGANISM="Scyphosphaera apsteinii, Strain RCC1455" /LENGTH=163 /DNA_ID=CAMNT_0007320613 /DNA_START=174 /DNA_END=665 /DNA_ORIENTATION=+